MRHKLIGLLLLLLAPPYALALVFSGEVRSSDSQPILVPPSNSSPVVLRYYMADGATVKPGDVVLRIDAGQAATQIINLDAQLAQTTSTNAKTTAELQLKAVEAAQALAIAQAALDTARVDAAIPKELISALDFDRHHAELLRSQKDLTLKQRNLADAQAAVEHNVKDGKLQLDKLTLQRDYYKVMVEGAAVHAERAGTLVHGFGNLFGGGRYEEGSSAYPGVTVGEIVGTGAMTVRAWVLAPDRAGLHVGENTCMMFDAMPAQVVDGTIKAISGAPEERAEWGDGRYFVVDLDLANAAALPLISGMSVRVRTRAANETCKVAKHAAAIDRNPVHASGEIFARSSVAISPPQVEDLWRLTITRMADDGGKVKKGEPIVSFDGSEVMKNLVAKKSELEEKQRTQEKLRLELAVKARTEDVSVAEAAADAVKAQRKASEPADFVPGVEYKKLLIDRTKAQELKRLSVAHAKAAADERRAEQRQADADVVRLKADVARLTEAVGSLNIVAPRDGIFMHATGWDGSMIDVGKQIWRGQSVADIPDLNTLGVSASLAERDLTRVHVGDTVRVVVEGGAGRALSGRVDAIGLSVHSKSRVEPVPVIDIDIALDAKTAGLKPGQPVSIEWKNAMPVSGAKP
ncbi:MAG TPA: HlyD family efflux transporter periplasmic adaptor subunit [Rudaea sp.]|nr:HlyD family efflux transporter periplasmic adaptor subunit [Rudaea sp.]